VTGSGGRMDDVRSNLVVSARITSLPQRLGDPLPEVWVTCEDGNEAKVFDFYPDEISFSGDDFVGLTLEECRLLKFGRDRAFLQR
jgi:hypothetical protein